MATVALVVGGLGYALCCSFTSIFGPSQSCGENICIGICWPCYYCGAMVACCKDKCGPCCCGKQDSEKSTPPTPPPKQTMDHEFHSLYI